MKALRLACFAAMVAAASGMLAGGGQFSSRSAPAARTASAPTLTNATRDQVLRYIHQRFALSDSVKLSLGALGDSFVPGFYAALVNVDDGKNKPGQQPVLISKDSRYLIVGAFIKLAQNSEGEMTSRLRETLKIPANVKLSVGGFKPSAAADFEEGTVHLDDGKAKQDKPLLLSRDGEYLVYGELYNFGVDLRRQALETLSARNAPSQGPASAPVTMFEFADLECPMCARVHDFLETQLLPRYGKKVRVVFKEFPLPMHDWSLTAAVACQCAYEIDPPAYVPLRSAIFKNQQMINVANVREAVLNLAEAAGVDRVKLAGCLDAKSSLPRVEHDVAEGKRVNVAATPTFFINGRMVVGLPSNDAYYDAVDQALREATGGTMK